MAFRLVRTDDSTSPEFTNSFRSRSALGHPPRAWTQEGSNPEIGDGISAYRACEDAAATARKARRRGRDIGEYVAEMHLQEGQGIEIAEWGAHGHLTIWGDPLMLVLQVVDIVPVTPAEDAR